MEHIPIQWLQAFVLFAESRDMQEAARRLGITQPALSKQLKALQSRLPTAAFVQEGKRKVLSSYGQDLLLELKPRFHALDESIRHVGMQHLQGQRTEVRISARREILDRLARDSRYKGTLILSEAGRTETLQALQHKSADVGITYNPPNSEDPIAKVLFRENFQFVIPKSLLPRLPSEEKWPEVMTKLPCVAYREQDEILTDATRAMGMSPDLLKPHRITANYLSLFHMVEAGLGWGVLPRFSSFNSSSCWFVPVPAKAITSRDFYVLYRKEHSRSRWLKELLTELTGCFKT